ncbi:hypothetical protein AM501_05940 [Aneurinibacillus migulanus]|uniref:hypothetical protein n=1 Tax=Aneurinibacillus migulanus TaxID=47500 RepID=UPI0005BD291C|nr:hypothetical protein [Aneurinibacillus migulanus]KIV54157.1 hypothetical protein TS64_13565 [Aneurinibacillus migulanus]KPD09158.1 hypothetical protein AM501_05940 [Aneurinibacillus migulanus]
MEKQCTRCNHVMHLYLRKLVYMNHTQIEHVPMYRCCYCEHHELVEQVKEDLKQCLQHLRMVGEQRAISFAEHSAFTRMMLEGCTSEISLDVDEWLDLYLLVQSLGDTLWQYQIIEALRRTQQ